MTRRCSTCALFTCVLLLGLAHSPSLPNAQHSIQHFGHPCTAVSSQALGHSNAEEGWQGIYHWRDLGATARLGQPALAALITTQPLRLPVCTLQMQHASSVVMIGKVHQAKKQVEHLLRRMRVVRSAAHVHGMQQRAGLCLAALCRAVSRAAGLCMAPHQLPTVPKAVTQLVGK